MPRFFTQGVPAGGLLQIEGEDAHHIIHVLRMKEGDALTLCNSAGMDYSCVIEDTSGGLVRCRVNGETPSAGEPSLEVILYMALPKGDKLELVIQKAVELGVSRIVPFLGARCVSKPVDPARKAVRWRRIAAEAAKQCGRGRIPEVADVMPFREAAAEAAKADTALFFYECERENALRGVIGGRRMQSAALVIGPEGGFALEEAELARQSGLISVSLGKRILRCETAPLAALAAVMYESGNL